MKTFRIACLLLATCTSLSKADAISFDCPVVRAHVAQYGMKASVRWARAQGYSVFEIAMVRVACFKKQQ